MSSHATGGFPVAGTSRWSASTAPSGAFRILPETVITVPLETSFGNVMLTLGPLDVPIGAATSGPSSVSAAITKSDASLLIQPTIYLCGDLSRLVTNP
jgi:hypothetical protein